jgi:hypothetical protein
MLYWEKNAVNCENNIKYTECQNAEFLYVEIGDTYRTTGL